ncbi:MAG: diguanylate cyclase, partial [Methyloprofundus sp.]|nr:diguanylate cyclase [Methyloprofundus sp.]
LKKSLNRASDYVARYGGEEFVVILPDTELDKAAHIAEKLRLAVMQLEIEHVDSKVSAVVTVSLGVADMVFLKNESHNISLVREADKCLYQAKEKGRNCVVSAGLSNC